MSTAYSQNGWTVIWKNGPQLTTIPVIIGKVRAGDVAIVFADLIEELAKIVGLNDRKDDWGWNVRPIRGQVNGYSNHASGTAIDLDATEHPRGVQGTWTSSDKAKVHKLLDRYDGVIRWGEDYNPNLSKVDGMHFEVHASKAAVKKVADRIKNGGVVPPKPKPPTKKNANAHRKYGAGEVKSIQEALNYAGYNAGKADNDYGPGTEDAVKDYQRHQQFPPMRADGDWGPGTQAHYEWTRRLQNTLNKWASVIPDLRLDGDFGSATTKAVRQVQDGSNGDGKPQKAYKAVGGKVVDGDPGPLTCKMLHMPVHP